MASCRDSCRTSRCTGRGKTARHADDHHDGSDASRRAIGAADCHLFLPDALRQSIERLLLIRSPVIQVEEKRMSNMPGNYGIPWKP
jgi:hypothetical protein